MQKLSPSRQRKSKIVLAGASLLAAVWCAGVAYAPPSVAQNAPASRAGTRPAPDVLARLAQAASVLVVADSTVTERVPLPASAATPETIEQQIAEVVKALPEGATWTKLYLPTPADGRAWRGDDVSAYLRAQAALFGRAGRAPDGTVEIWGQRLSAEKAKQTIADLNLKPVYLVTNPKKAAAVTAGANGPADVQQWMQMTPEQRQQQAKQEAEQLANMDPVQRSQMLERQEMIRRELFRKMGPERFLPLLRAPRDRGPSANPPAPNGPR